MQTPQDQFSAQIEGTAIKTAFVFAHPGHEFRLLDTICALGGPVYILTQGTRHHTSCERINASARLIESIGATAGSVFGEATDREFYTAVIANDALFFDDLCRRLARAFQQDAIERVITDAWQNYNPIHDLAHICARVATSICARQGHKISLMDYPVITPSMTETPIGKPRHIRKLTDTAIAFKQTQLDAYPDIAADALALINEAGQQALAIESLHDPMPLEDLFPTSAPFYESYGRKRIASGVYDQLVTFAHVRQIVDQLTEKHA